MSTQPSFRTYEDLKPGEYLQLEHLLGKLRAHIGTAICLVPEHIHDGYSIGSYDSNGNLNHQAASHDLQSAVSKLKRSLNPSNTITE